MERKQSISLIEMIESVVEFSADWLSWLQIVRAVAREFSVRVTVQQAKKAAGQSKRQAIEIEGKIRFEF